MWKTLNGAFRKKKKDFLFGEETLCHIPLCTSSLPYSSTHSDHNVCNCVLHNSIQRGELEEKNNRDHIIDMCDL